MASDSGIEFGFGKITDPNHKTRYPKKGVGYERLGRVARFGFQASGFEFRIHGCALGPVGAVYYGGLNTHYTIIIVKEPQK